MPFFSAHLKGIEKSSSKLHNFYDKNIRETMERVKNEAKSGIVDDEEDTYFIKALYKKWNSRNIHQKLMRKKKASPLQTLEDFVRTCLSDTTSNTMNFLILYMVVFPEVQAKMQEELDQVMGDNEDGKKLICLAEKAKLPYTNAVINESQRLVNLVPITLIHRTTKDVVIGGYAVKKGARIVPQVSSVLYDEKIFPKPHEFIPERFIEDGQLKKCEELIPFSLGKRQCLGESMARMELFLFTANLFYLYKMSAVNPLKPPSLEKVTGLTVSPIKYNCIIEKRKQHLSN
uniref:Cytochrome P450 n=1 Tax=Ditylenchus dipsaci TaxID=166011 RepID=A0A915EKT0_9BILA